MKHFTEGKANMSDPYYSLYTKIEKQTQATAYLLNPTLTTFDYVIKPYSFLTTKVLKMLVLTKWY